MDAVLEKNAENACPVRREWREVGIVLPSSFTLESGETLSQPQMRVRTYGNIANPAVAVFGGISAGRKVADVLSGNLDREKGWWGDIVRDGGPIDLGRFCIVGFDFLPNEEEQARTITTNDQAAALAFALDKLGIDRLHAIVGASYGGMVGLAFAALFPRRVDHLCVLSAADHTNPAATAFRGVQRRIIEFGQQTGNDADAVALARQLAMITYRTAEEFEQRFSHAPSAERGDPYDVCGYLIARGGAYTMSAERYLTMSDSIDRHVVDVRKVKVPTLLIGVTQDRLVPPSDMRRLADQLNTATYVEIESIFGHDAFLKETDLIGPQIKSFLEEHDA